MIFFKWATLLLAVWRHSALTVSTVASSKENNSSQHLFHFNLSAAGQTAEAGLCVVIPCSFTTNENVTAQHVAWYKCEETNQTCNKSLIFDSNKTEPASDFKGRVSMVESDLSKKNCSITIRDLKKSDSGSYQLRVYGNFSGKTNGYMLSNKTNITVTDLRQKPTVTISSQKLGEQTTVICTAPGLCSEPVPQITWTWRGKAENVFHITGKSSNLNFNLSAEHHGAQVTCKVSFTANVTTEETLTLNVTGVNESGITEQSSKHPCANQTTDTTVTSPLRFSNSSGCHKQSDVLTCVCIFEGFPIHSVNWPLIKNYTNYSVITTVTNHTVNSSLTVTVTDDMNTTIKCVDMIVVCHMNVRQSEEDAVMKLLKIVTQLEVIVAFFIGVLLSTIFCCLMRVCCRKKHKTPENVETMEMVIHQESPLIEDGQAVEDDHSDPQEAAEEGAGAAAGKSDVEYSTIHFSASKSNSVAKLENLPETPETEYAEIKTEAEERRAGEDRQETGNMEEAGGDALYSDVKDVMGEI